MYILLSAAPPYEGKNDSEILANVRKNNIDFKIPEFKSLSKEAKDLMKKCLEINPEKRITAEKAIQHPWFRKMNTNKMLYSLDAQLIKDMVQNIINYKCTTIIQETALAYLVHNYPQQENIKNAYKFFNLLNKSSNGKITRTEFYQALSPYIKDKNSEEIIDKIFTKLDTDKNNLLEYEEFVRAAVDKRSFLKEDFLKLAFTYFDKEKTGVITIAQISSVFKDFLKGEAQNKEQNLHNILGEVDKDGDGKINFEEFQAVMMQFDTKIDGNNKENNIENSRN